MELLVVKVLMVLQMVLRMVKIRTPRVTKTVLLALLVQMVKEELTVKMEPMVRVMTAPRVTTKIQPMAPIPTLILTLMMMMMVMMMMMLMMMMMVVMMMMM